ncbi:MAG: hypothetical protein NTV55_04785 [Planctomycetota bacterium]|nr:hypothetical protein [Planctomycetota bacterium]RLS41160.1 MAG: hypothetical protein DWH82_01105 [Planctomycetota bacterium]
MFKTICTLLLTAVLAMEACAGPFTVLRRGVGNNGGSGYSVDTSSAQSVAYYLASTQRVGHYGGNYAFEGVGMGGSAQAAINSCCKPRFGGQPREVGVAQSATGMFYACCRW